MFHPNYLLAANVALERLARATMNKGHSPGESAPSACWLWRQNKSPTWDFNDFAILYTKPYISLGHFNQWTRSLINPPFFQRWRWTISRDLLHKAGWHLAVCNLGQTFSRIVGARERPYLPNNLGTLRITVPRGYFRDAQESEMVATFGQLPCAKTKYWRIRSVY
jgi:hypothetical protein